MRLGYAQALVLVALVGGVVGAGAILSGSYDGGSHDGGQTLLVEQVGETKLAGTDAVLRISATLNNTGGADATQPVRLLVDTSGDGVASTVVAERTATVPSGATVDLAFDVSPETLGPGTYAYAVAVGETTDSRWNGTVALQSPTFAVADASASEAVRGEDASISATVHNRGDYRGTQTVELRVDRNGDGSYADEEVVASTEPTVSATESARLDFAVPTEELAPGTYGYQVVAPGGTTEGTITVLQPATFRLGALEAPGNVTRGETLNVSATVTNEGDVPGRGPVGFELSAGRSSEIRSVELAAGESTTLEFTAGTATLSRGSYSVRLATVDDSASTAFRVRDSHFEVTSLRGRDTLTLGEEMQFTATVRNTGDLGDTQSIEYRLDLNDDDVPEAHGLNRSVSLAPGERTTVRFTVPYGGGDARIHVDELLGTHIHGIYSEDGNATSVVVVEEKDDDEDDSTSSRRDSEAVSLSEISQEKYGLDYGDLSGETKGQVSEIHQRQPFADGLVVTEVLTREEIARERFGLDVGAGDRFDFTALDVETQQRIEAIFDAQFQSDAGDRVESWDELARRYYGSDYENLSDSGQETVRELYWEQFEDDS